jgi:hypothetical protein
MTVCRHLAPWDLTDRVTESADELIATRFDETAREFHNNAFSLCGKPGLDGTRWAANRLPDSLTGAPARGGARRRRGDLPGRHRGRSATIWARLRNPCAWSPIVPSSR